MMSSETEAGNETAEPVALVTAGASGIGRAIARRLLKKGFRIHICDVDPLAIDLVLPQLA